MKTIAQFAYKQAERTVNKGCPWFLFQPKVPEKVKELKKHN